MEEADLWLLDAIQRLLDTKRVSYRLAMRMLDELSQQPDLFEGVPNQTEHAKEVQKRIEREQ